MNFLAIKSCLKQKYLFLDSSADNKSVISEKVSQLSLTLAKSSLKFIFIFLLTPSQIVQQIVQEALDRYSADKVGMADFALESSGMSLKQK